MAYYHLPKLLLETGGLEEPFGFRRLGALGVAALLQSFFVPFWPVSGVRFADATLGGLLVWGAARALAPLAGAPRGSLLPEAFGLLGSIASLTLPVWNSAPILLPLGATLVLLWLSAELLDGREAGREGVALALGWGATAVLLTGFRTSNVVFPGLLGLAGVGFALARRDAAALAPWSLASWRSSGTPFFPLIRGNYRFPGGLLAPLSPGETLEFVAAVLWGSGLWLPLLLAGLAGRARDRRATASAYAAALLGTVVTTALALTASDLFDVIRYVGPFVAAATVFGSALWLGSAAAGGRRLALVAVAALAWTIVPVRIELAGRSGGGGFFASSPARQIWNNGKAALETARWALERGVLTEGLEGAAHFAAVQDLLGDDARIVSAVATPFLWRFDRHVVHMVDTPGHASPPPGMPFFQGADALAGYWLDLGYTHLAFVPPSRESCLYSIRQWEAAQRRGDWLWQQWAPYFKDFLRNETLLARRARVVYASPEVVVVDLRRALDAPR